MKVTKQSAWYTFGWLWFLIQIILLLIAFSFFSSSPDLFSEAVSGPHVGAIIGLIPFDMSLIIGGYFIVTYKSVLRSFLFPLFALLVVVGFMLALMATLGGTAGWFGILIIPFAIPVLIILFIVGLMYDFSASRTPKDSTKL